MADLRVIPSLLVDGKRLLKGVKFKNHRYIGDVVNAIKIFNEKEVDELVILDIRATAVGRPPDVSIIEDIASEAFFPLAYGGGITTISQVEELMACGIEKVVLGSSAFHTPHLVTEASKLLGAQSVVVAVDYKKDLFGRWRVYVESGKRNIGRTPLEYCLEMESLGAGELILSCIDKEGTYGGYDTDTNVEVNSHLSIPVIPNCGSAKIEECVEVAKAAGALGVCAGSIFSFYGPHKAVLINYPGYEAVQKLWSK